MTSSQSTITHQHLDVGLFVQLYGDMSIFPSVARVFSGVIIDWREQVQRAMIWSDAKALSDSMHKMKGCCEMMGAPHLAADIGRVEHSLKRDEMDANMPGLLDILRKIGEMEEEVKSVCLT